MNIILTSIKAMPEMSTVHGTSPVFLGSFVLRNEQHWEHAAPFLCRACQRCSLMNHNGSLWEVVTPSEMGGKQAGRFSCCGFVQMVWCRCRTIEGEPQGQPSTHEHTEFLGGTERKDVSCRGDEARSSIPTVPRQAPCAGKADPTHMGAPSVKMKGLRNQRRQELCWGPSLCSF